MYNDCLTNFEPCKSVVETNDHCTTIIKDFDCYEVQIYQWFESPSPTSHDYDL